VLLVVILVTACTVTQNNSFGAKPSRLKPKFSSIRTVVLYLSLLSFFQYDTIVNH